jgi:DNA-binding NarL/FixJ family response regulator/signal transduction histidine kinase
VTAPSEPKSRRSARKQTEEELRQRSHDLGERVKELNCLYGISRLREETDRPLGETLQKIVELIPPAWHYPEITCAQITLEGQSYEIANFERTQWVQTASLTIHGAQVGTVEVCYLKEMPELDEGPFLAEERNLINAIAERVSRIIEHHRARERVLEYQEELRYLASQVSLSEERERRRIAVSLHDRVGHILAIAKFKLEDLQESVPADTLNEIIQLIDQTIKDTRSLTFELSPPVLHELGFEAALEWLTKQTREQHPISTEFVDDGLPKPLGDDMRVVLFQAVRELLVNVSKHAHAESVKVSSRRSGDAIQIHVEDDGVGFDPFEVASRRGKDGGFGLFNISERLGYLDGRMEISSMPGNGTRVILTAPLKSETRNQTGRGKRDDAVIEGIKSRTDRTITVLLADDHQITREGIRALLEKEPDINVVAEAENGLIAVELARELSPDVILMDITMPEMNGIDATRRIISEGGSTKIIALSMHSDKQYVLEMLRAGASGYLLKDCAQGDLARAVRTVDSNLTFFSPEIADAVVEEYARHQAVNKGSVASILTPREREVLQLLAGGMNTKEIAMHIAVSTKTIETHRQHIMEKLKLRSVAELTKYAIREGLTDLDSNDSTVNRSAKQGSP